MVAIVGPPGPPPVPPPVPPKPPPVPSSQQSVLGSEEEGDLVPRTKKKKRRPKKGESVIPGGEGPEDNGAGGSDEELRVAESREPEDKPADPVTIRDGTNVNKEVAAAAKNPLATAADVRAAEETLFDESSTATAFSNVFGLGEQSPQEALGFFNQDKKED